MNRASGGGVGEGDGGAGDAGVGPGAVGDGRAPGGGSVAAGGTGPPPTVVRHVAATRGDKKARGGVVEYALPRRVGAMAGEQSGWGVRVPDASVREVLA